MTARFTFAVCTKCGVQSQPILLLPGEPKDLREMIEQIGWKFDRLRFNIMATCPGCSNDKKETELS